jgi:hypothetical protein
MEAGQQSFASELDLIGGAKRRKSSPKRKAAKKSKSSKRKTSRKSARQSSKRKTSRISSSKQKKPTQSVYNNPARRRDFLMRVKLEMMTGRGFDAFAAFDNDIRPSTPAKEQQLLREVKEEWGVSVPTNAEAKKVANKKIRKWNADFSKNLQIFT